MAVVQVERRRNLVTNPSFETNTTGWTASGAATIARSTAQAYVGTASLAVTLAAGGGFTQGAAYTVTGLTVGTVYTASAWLYAPTASLPCQPVLAVNGVNFSPPVTSGDTWLLVAVTWTATATSHTLSVGNGNTATAGMVIYADAVLVEAASAPADYFDGDTPDVGSTSTVGSVVYAWTGTAHASASTMTVTQSTIAVTVTPEPGSSPPRMRIDIADTAATPIASVVITRRNPSGRAYPVRTSDAGPLPLSAGQVTIFDYEPPYGATVTYSLNAADAPTVTAELDTDDIWLVHVGVPGRSVRLDKVTKLAEHSRPSSSVLLQVLDRADPIVVSSGARPTASGVLGVRTLTDAQRRAMDALLDDDVPVLLNIPPSKQWGMDSSYLAIRDVQVARTVQIGAVPLREWQLPYQVISRPGGGTQAAITVLDVAAQYATDQAIVDAGVRSYAELAAPTR